MIAFRAVNNFAFHYFGVLFYLIPLFIYGFLKLKAKNQTLPEGFASFEKRALAFLIDYALIQGFTFGVHFVLIQLKITSIFWVFIASLLFSITNMIIIPAKTGWSLGKRALSIYIAKKDEKKLGIYDMLYREIIKSWFSLSIFFLGCFWMMIGKSQLTWHDSVADTRVLNMNWRQANKSLERITP